MPTREEFRAGLVTFSERVQKFRGLLKNEEATKLSLIQPFISLLGYDPLDPTEVSAEHSADFSEKYKNRADYVILKENSPVISIECKSIGNGKKDDRGQLKSYFNAVKSVKLGILTDGAVYELFVDSNEPNMMDDEPYLTVDFDRVSKGHLADTEVDGLFALTKWNFDPESVGESAKRSIVYRSIYDYLAQQFTAPSPEFTRFLLKEIDIKNVRSTSIESYRDIVRAAFTDVFNANVMRKLEIPGPISTVVQTLPQAIGTIDTEAAATAEKGIITTLAELAAFEAIKLRLAFLVSGNVEHFEKLSKIRYRDYQGKMLVYYEMERKGRLVDILEAKDGTIRFVVMDGGDASPTMDLPCLDDRLKALFSKRVAELG